MGHKAFATLVSIFVAGYAIHIFQRRRRRLPPGPSSFPLVGQLLSAPLSFEHLGYKRLSEQLKSDIICLEFLGNTVVVLHSSQSASDLLEKSSAIYSDRTFPTMVEDKTLLNWGDGLLFSSGEQIRAYRRILNTWLNKNASVAFHDRQVFQTRQLLTRLLNLDGQTLSSERLMAEYYRFTAASIIGATYGYDIASLEDPFFVGIQEVVDNLTASVLPTRFLVNAMPSLVHVPDWFPGTGWKHTAKVWRQQKDKILDDTYQWTKDQMARHTAKPSILRSILEEYEAIGAEVPDEERERYKQLCIAIFGAGSDTTAGTLTAFTIAMLLFSDVQQKAQEEIDRVIGFDRLPEMSDLPQLPYLANLMQELLRWQPVLPLGIPHTCSQDNVYRGYTIPKGTVVIGNVWAMSRDPSVYKNPDIFDPDRFLDPTTPPVPAFGWGRRKCPGIPYAESALFISIASVLAAFNITKAKDADGQDIIPSTAGQPSALIYRPQPFSCVLTSRSDAHRRLIAEIGGEA